MNARPTIPLARLLNEGSLERVPFDADVCRNLLRQAAAHLTTAAAGVDGGDDEGAFTLAYDACRKACLALVMATGLRPKGEAGHAVTFEAAATIADNFGGRVLVGDAGDLRHVRHGAEYRAEAINATEATEAIDIGKELVAMLGPQVEKILAAR